MTHIEYAKKIEATRPYMTPCLAQHLTFGNRCLNCGYDPSHQVTLTLPHSSGYGVSEYTIPGPYSSLAEMKAANKKAGLHFFDRNAMVAFDSKPSARIYAGRFFIDSVQFHGMDGYSAPREYKVYAMSDSGETNQIAIPPSDWDGKTPRGKEDNWTKANFASMQEAIAFVNSILKKAQL